MISPYAYMKHEEVDASFIGSDCTPDAIKIWLQNRHLDPPTPQSLEIGPTLHQIPNQKCHGTLAIRGSVFLLESTWTPPLILLDSFTFLYTYIIAIYIAHHIG